MSKKNLPLKSTSHIVLGTWLVYIKGDENIRLNTNSFGKQTIYINDQEVDSFRTFKSKFERTIEHKGGSYTIKMNSESISRAENVFTFHKNGSIVRIIKTQFKFSFIQVSVIIFPIVLLSFYSEPYEITKSLQYILTFIWFIIAVILTGKNYLHISGSDNPNFE